MSRSPFALLPARALTAPFAAAMAPSALAFARAIRDPRAAQAHALAKIAREVHALSPLRALSPGPHILDELRARWPLTTYEDYADDIDRIAQGTAPPTLLTSSPAVRFERSGGSTGAQKLLPMTQPFLDEMNRALSPWLHRTYRGPAGAGCSYWALSPLGDRARVTPSGIPVGASDSDWFPAFLRPLIARVLAVDESVARIPDLAESRRATARLLLEREDLSFISVWSPTFLTLLLDAVDEELRASTGRRGKPRPHGSTGATVSTPRRRHDGSASTSALADVWPRLRTISMWTDASSARFVPEVQARLPHAHIEPKGLLAVEGAISIPWAAHPQAGRLRHSEAERLRHSEEERRRHSVEAPVLAIRSHVLEFLDDSGRAFFAHEVEDGREYEIVLTTSAGLVRYRLGDRVVVLGRAEATPRIRFIGRANVSDLVGEKLSSAFVGSVLDRVFPSARFAMLAPVTSSSPPHYRAYLDAGAVDVGRAQLHSYGSALDDALSEGHPYRYARALGQLGPVDVVVVADALARYERCCLERGQRAGDIKALPLSSWDPWPHGLS